MSSEQAGQEDCARLNSLRHHFYDALRTAFAATDEKVCRAPVGQKLYTVAYQNQQLFECCERCLRRTSESASLGSMINRLPRSTNATDR
jgi:hypothetical protein